MAQVFEINGIVPVIDPTAYVHPTAVLIGDAIVGPGCYVGPNACMRGDFGRLILREGANLQDTCVMHGFPGGDTVVEENGHIGHGAVLHGCRVSRHALVGMNSVIMDGAVVGEEALVAAMSFVKAKFEVPRRTLVAGSPAKVIREVSDQEFEWKKKGTAEYQKLARRCLETMRPVTALTEFDPSRTRVEASEAVPHYVDKERRE